MAKLRFLIALLAAILAVTSAAAPSGCSRPVQMVGGYSPIPDVKDPDVQKLGEWAVAQQARLARVKLQFCTVRRGEEQVVAGMNYNLVVEAVGGARKSAFYLVGVSEDLAGNRTLTSFEPAARCPAHVDLCA